MTATKPSALSITSLHLTVSAAPLTVYRISFGLLMLFSTLRFIAKGWVTTQYIAPSFHFPYYGFGWLPYPSETGIWFLFAGMVLGALLITLGCFYRLGTLLFLLSFTYVELLDKTNYLNHYYFVSLIAFLLLFLPAHRHFSLDAKWGRVKASHQCRQWEIRILQFQIAAVYFFAGIAKLETDWLWHAQPLKYWLHTAHHWPLVGPLLKQDAVAHLFSWTACLYDLAIVPLLLLPATRKAAYGLVVLFHLLTWMLFPIGVFPWVMIVGTLIFFPPSFHQKIVDRLGCLFSCPQPSAPLSAPTALRRRITSSLLLTYVAVQLLVPLRCHLYDGHLMWTEHGFRFSWRVMLMEKVGQATFFVTNPSGGHSLEIDNSAFLTPNQERMMATQPDMLLQFAHHLADVYRDTVVERYGLALPFTSPEVHATVFVTLNARPHQLYVDARHNLAALPDNLAQRSWLEPFKQ